MKVAGIVLLLASVVLVAISLLAPLVLSFWAIASSDAPPRAESFSNAVVIPLIGLPSGAVAAIVGIVLIIFGFQRR